MGNEEIEYILTPSSPEGKVQQIVDKWRKILLMADWDITWSFNDALGVDAQVRAYCSEHRLKMAFSPAILEYTPKEFEETISHEMIHGLTQPMDNYIRPWIDEFLPSSAQVPFWRGYNDVAENVVVDNLVRILMGQVI